MISHHHRLIFVHVPKCAGMAVEQALGGLPPGQRPEQHFTAHQYRRYHPDLWEAFHRFTVVRDPLRRCLSFVRFYRRWDAVWRRHLAHVPDEVLLRDLLMSVNLLTTHGPSRMLTGEEEVLRLEELADSWPAFADRHGLPDELPRHNAAPRPTERDALTPATQLFVAARFPQDFTRYGYPLPDVRTADLPEPEQGAVMWARLRAWAHEHLEGAPTGDPQEALDAWIEDLPVPAWRARFLAVAERLPPPIAPRGNLVLWSEVVHDEVRGALGQPLWHPWTPESTG